MITTEQYFATKPHTEAHTAAATDLLNRVNAMCGYLNYEPLMCPNTGTQVSGSKNGQGDGGFRLLTATTGTPHSSHKEARGVDVYDPDGALDAMITDEILERYGLFREAPETTPTWVHLTTRAPASGHRTFEP